MSRENGETLGGGHCLNRKLWGLGAGIVVLIAVFVSYKVLHVPKNPPAPWQIADQMNRIWAAGEWSDVTKYVEQLAERYPGYVPARCAAALWASSTGQDPDARKRCSIWALSKGKDYPQYFDHDYRKYLEETEEFSARHDDQGDPAAYFQARLKNFGPELELDEWLYIALAPMIALSGDAEERVKEYSPSFPRRLGLTMEDLYATAKTAAPSYDTQIGAVYGLKRLGGRRAIPYLKRLVDLGDVLIPTQACIVLASFEQDAVDIFLDMLKNSESFSEELAMFGLMRIGDNSPKVIEALEETKQNLLLRGAAEEAIAFLKAQGEAKNATATEK